MKASEFCNLSISDAAAVLAHSQLLGRSARVKVALDWQTISDQAKSLGSSLWDPASTSNPQAWQIAGGALAGGLGGGALGALAGHKRRRGSAVTGALLGALAGGGLSAAGAFGGPGLANTTQTKEQAIEQQRDAAALSTDPQAAKDLHQAEVDSATSGVMPPAPKQPPSIQDPVFHKSLFNQVGFSENEANRLGAGTYAAMTGRLPTAHDLLIKNPEGARIGGALGAGAGLLHAAGRQSYDSLTAPGQLKGVSDDVLAKVFKGSDLKELRQKIDAGPNVRWSRSPLIPGHNDRQALTALQMHRNALTPKGTLSTAGRGFKRVLPTLGTTALGYLLGGNMGGQ